MAMMMAKRKKGVIHIVFTRYINGARGVISLFLALLMLPFTFIAGALINAARVDSAVAIFDEALCNASDSALGTYDEFLRKRFGLLAMSQEIKESYPTASVYTPDQFLKETFEFYMKENMKVLSNTYTDVDYAVEGRYPLASQEVLLSQVLEYGKYSVPVKLVNDTLDLDHWISELEKTIFGSSGQGIFSLAASIADTGTAFIELSGACKELKETINVQKTKETEYESSYVAFSGAVSEYVELYEERVRVLEQLQQEIEDLEQAVQEYKDDKSKESELQEAEEQLAQSRTDYDNAVTDYENRLSVKAAEIEKTRTAYAASIGGVMDALRSTKEKVEDTQEKIKSFKTNVGNTVAEGVGVVFSSLKDDNEARIEDLKTNGGQENAAKIQSLKDENTELGNASTMATTAIKDGSKTMLTEASKGLTEYNTAVYESCVVQLFSLKEKVEGYTLPEVPSELSQAEYHNVQMDGLVTKEDVDQAEKDLVEQCTKSTILGMLKAVVKFFEALMNLEGPFNPRLGANIDMDYYRDTYGGLPSQKDRDVYPLQNGSSEDAELSAYYKEIIGGYQATGLGTDTGLDLMAELNRIFQGIGTLLTNVGKLTNPVTAILSLFKLGDILKEIGDAMADICGSVQRIFAYLGNIISDALTAIGQKTLLTGYLRYMLSDRTTYGGKTLAMQSFNLREQEETQTLFDSSAITLFSILSTLNNAFNGEKQKCFVGAEMEYILIGSPSEVGNQLATFGMVYLFRLALNFAPVLLNGEVRAIAAASTIFSPIVFLLYILIEPLIDALLLVNGDKVALWKSVMHITPSGIGDLIKSIGGIGLSKEQLDEVKKEFPAIQSASTTQNTSDSNEFLSQILKTSYSDTLFLIATIFYSNSILVERLGDVIEMESVQALCKDGGENARFDLDYSYTYLRVEARFSMSEFIPLSANNLLRSRKRIVYRGY